MKLSFFVLALAAVSQSSALKAHEHDKMREAYVQELNSKPGMTWRAHVSPRFKGLPLGASKDLCGVHNTSKAELHKLGNRINSRPLGAAPIPDSFDSEANWPECAKVIGEIRDQSNCGCCWAFGAASAASDRLCINTQGKEVVSLSAQDVCFCASFNGCQGGTLYTPWSYVQKKGVVTGAQYQNSGPFNSSGFCSQFSLPHCHHHGPQGDDPYPAEGQPGCPSQSSPSCPRTCDSSAKPPHDNFKSDKYTFTGGNVATFGPDADVIAAEIMARGPVEAAFSVYSDFENYAGGIYQHTGGQMLGGHAIRIVGWGVENGVKYWKVANSWNPYWGENGYFRIIRGKDECGIESQVTANSPKATWGKSGEEVTSATA